MCTLYSIISPICQPIAISRPSWRNRGALYTEYGVQIRCVRRDQSSSVGNLPPSPFLSSLLLPSSFFYSPPLYSFPWALRHSTQPSLLSLPPSFTLFSPLFPSLLHSLDTLTPSFTQLSNTWALYKPHYYYAETWFNFCPVTLYFHNYEWVCDTLAKADDDRGDGRTECSVKTVSFFLRLSILTNSACKHSMKFFIFNWPRTYMRNSRYTHMTGNRLLSGVKLWRRDWMSY